MGINVKILGSNSASFAHNRHHTSQLIQVQDKYLLIDCGEGTQLQLKRFGAKLSKIDYIFISHLHGDHYYGLIGLLSTMHLYGRQKPMKLIAPPGLAEIIRLQLRHSETILQYPIHFTEWKPDTIELVLDEEKFTVETIPLDHRVPCSGYLIKEKPKKRRLIREAIDRKLTPAQVNLLKDGHDILDDEGNIMFENRLTTRDPAPSVSYAYCSDTRYKPVISSQIFGTDLLYHETTFMQEMAERAHNTYHTTTEQAGILAREAKVKKLIIGHFSTRYKELDPVVEEVRTIFSNSELAIEGKVFTIE